LDGGLALERRKGTDRKQWRWDEVMAAAWPALVARHEGSMLDALDDLLALLPLTASNGPRVTPFRDLGFDPDEFCESKPGRMSVQVIGGEK
jgi:hypothetical protein